MTHKLPSSYPEGIKYPYDLAFLFYAVNNKHRSNIIKQHYDYDARRKTCGAVQKHIIVGCVHPGIVRGLDARHKIITEDIPNYIYKIRIRYAFLELVGIRNHLICFVLFAVQKHLVGFRSHKSRPERIAVHSRVRHLVEHGVVIPGRSYPGYRKLRAAYHDLIPYI